MSLGNRGDADIRTVGDLAENKSSRQRRRKCEDKHDGVGAGVTEPVLFEGRLLQEATTTSHFHLHSSAGGKNGTMHRERDKEHISASEIQIHMLS